ncbi:hypothetical protein Tco_1561404 [Tanacetum coccineum]
MEIINNGLREMNVLFQDNNSNLWFARGLNNLYNIGMDISIITRKQSKMGKHEHEKRKSTKEARDAKPKPGKVKKSKLWSTSSQP